jgi:RNA polymerase sigma-70 factor (ECF subfamily)
VAIDQAPEDLLRAGDVRGAATAAIRTLGPRVLGYLRSLLRDEAEAAEAFSAFCEALWISLPGFRGDASLQTWAFRLARNTALSMRGEAWRRRVRPLETREAADLAEEVRTRSCRRVEWQRRALDRLRVALPEEDRTLLILRVDQGLAWDEIAVILGGPDGPVRANSLAKRYERVTRKLGALARAEGLLE